MTHLQIDILTLFPETFKAYLNASIMRRAQDAGLLLVKLHDLRRYGVGKHRITDDAPYGGGGGMVLKPEPIFAAVEAIIGQPADARNETGSRESRNTSGSSCPVILMTPQGRLFTQEVALELARPGRFIIVSGRYEGVDERVRQALVTDELSIGDYVLTGGELPAMIVLDAVGRLIPGVLGDEGAAERDSHASGLLEGPHYTRPESFRGLLVPEVLRSGHAAKIRRWRREQALRRTWYRRPELLQSASLSEEDKHFLMVLAEESVQSAHDEPPS